MLARRVPLVDLQAPLDAPRASPAELRVGLGKRLFDALAAEE